MAILLGVKTLLPNTTKAGQWQGSEEIKIDWAPKGYSFFPRSECESMPLSELQKDFSGEQEICFGPEHDSYLGQAENLVSCSHAIYIVCVFSPQPCVFSSQVSKDECLICASCRCLHSSLHGAYCAKLAFFSCGIKAAE